MWVLIALAAVYYLVQLGVLALAFKCPRNLKLPLLWIALLVGVQITWVLWVNESPVICNLLPFKYGVVVCNLIPGLIALMLAILIVSRTRSPGRVVSYGLLLLSIDIYFWGPAVYNPIKCGNAWSGACCLQTTDCTCMPAAAATLLKLRGITAREEELKQLCLTTSHGTTLWGVYHGLRSKADAAGRHVSVQNASFDDCVRANRPALILVMLNTALNARDSRYASQWGWQVNVAHAVVFLSALPGGRVAIADPKTGFEMWDATGLRALWRGTAIYLD